MELNYVRTITIAVCVAAGTAVTAHAQHLPTETSNPNSVAVDTVRLRFKWPAGESARIETRHYREINTETADTTLSITDYRMDVAEHADGLVISYSDFRFPGVDSAEAASIAAAGERIAALVPTIIVSRSGEFLRVSDTESLRAAFNAVLEEFVEPEAIEAMRGTLDQAWSDQSLTVLAAQEWDTLVGMWLDADLVAGDVYETEATAPVAIIPGAALPMVSQFTVAGRRPCVDDGSDNDCVEIRLVTRPDPDSLNVVLARFMEQTLAVPGLLQITFDELEITNELVLIAEPSTLRPHLMTVTQGMRGVVNVAGESDEVSQLEVTTKRYTYGRHESHHDSAHAKRRSTDTG